MPLAERSARLAALESGISSATLASSPRKEPKRRKRPHAGAPSAKKVTHDHALAEKVETLTSEFAQIKSLLLNLQPRDAVTVPVVPNEADQTNVVTQQEEDVVSIAATDSLYMTSDINCVEDEDERGLSPSHSLVGSHTSEAESLPQTGPGLSFVKQAVQLALSRLGVDNPPAETTASSAFFKVTQKPEFNVPVSQPYIEELHRCWADPKSLTHLSQDCRALSSMCDSAQYGLNRMPAVDSIIANLVVAPADAARPDARCPRPQCRVTDDLLTKSYDIAARIGRLDVRCGLRSPPCPNPAEAHSVRCRFFQAKYLDLRPNKLWSVLLRLVNLGNSLLTYTGLPDLSQSDVLQLFTLHPGFRRLPELHVLLQLRASSPSSLPFGSLRADPRELNGFTELPVIAPRGPQGCEAEVVGSDCQCLAPSRFSRNQLSHWEAQVQDPWVISTLFEGYRIQFRCRPPKFNGVRMTVVSDSVQSAALQREILELLEKGAIEPVHSSDQLRGFYSIYFLVPKKDGGFRPILDLRRLNRYIKVLQFHMLRTVDVLQTITPGDWFTSVDLKDAYFHVPVAPHHRQFLRFAFEGQAYQFRVLPFGLSLAPRTFTRCMAAALAPLQALGLRILPYLDDWLVCAPTQEQAHNDTALLLNHVSHLGLTVNFAKSSLVPSQQTTFIGIAINSLTMTASPSPQRVDDVIRLVSHIQRAVTLPFGLLLRLMGKLTAMSLVVPLGLLFLRPLQIWINNLGLNSKLHQHRLVRLSNQCLLHLRPWGNVDFICKGVPLGSCPSRREVVVTDASLKGWGAVWNHRMVRGVWSPQERLQHINVLELRAVRLALKHFLPALRGRHVLVRSDNTSTVYHINHQGGTRSNHSLAETRKLLLWALPRLQSVRAVHLPGVQNSAADLLSRQKPPPGEWRLNPIVVQMIWQKYGVAEVDLFASSTSTHCPRWYSLSEPDSPLGQDALAHPWPDCLLYAFPPLPLLMLTLHRIDQSSHRVLLVAPFWPGRIWFPMIYKLLEGEPWALPERKDLLSQLQGRIWHPHPERLQLYVWPLRGRTPC
ncbi:LOW QUALITY PROTEIN: uncharacterized protein LOC115081559 [Rhinatrema bivittatum]|uniref:LOW QUALITY PROTEIN: uncharacterized protein LOC115081559 n=1 Tax=Rhinatrema bivittatum TaxID=194408 RepID=UPI0011291A67|nr:LOW QUALITY PROTEIN: uncharacterized protein LOC115081559 [Rhinatrema bivittatum]